MPATSWTEASATGVGWTEDITSPDTFTGYALFGMPIPVDMGVVFADPSATWVEQSVSATSFTEQSVSATSWTEAGS